MTDGTVLRTMELAQDRKNVRIVTFGEIRHEAVIVNDQPVITTEPPQKMDAIAAAPAPTRANFARTGTRHIEGVFALRR